MDSSKEWSCMEYEILGQPISVPTGDAIKGRPFQMWSVN